jgi:hypothetical protein
MAIDQTLVTAFVSITYDGTELNIVDAKLSLHYDNNTKYEESMTSTGKKGYLLRKGISVTQEGDIFVTITKTGDGKQDDTIKFLETKLQEISKSEKPDDYSKALVITSKDPGEQQFLSVSFNGYLKELRVTPSKEGNAFTDYIAEFEIFDPLSIKISN